MELRRELLRLLREDEEFRYTVLGYLGLDEVIKSIKALQQQVADNTEAIRALQQQVAEHTEAIRSLQEQVRALQEQVAGHTEAIKALQQQVVEHTEAIRVLQRQVAEHTEAIRALQQQVAEHTKAIKVLQEQVAEHTKAIRALQQQVAEHTEVIRVLQEQVAKHTEAIKALQEQVAEHGKILERHTMALEDLGRKLVSLGVRWGVVAEESFREAMRRVLEERLGVATVERWTYFDKEGRVFEYPALIELDVVVRDRVHHLIEVKSSVDAYDVWAFNRKCEFYRELKGVEVRKLIVTCYADDKAREVARSLGVEVVSG